MARRTFGLRTFLARTFNALKGVFSDPPPERVDDEFVKPRGANNTWQRIQRDNNVILLTQTDLF